MNNCKNCKNSLKRCDFSFKKYGSYNCPLECTLIENEIMPYRKDNDTCNKFEEREDNNND